MSKLPRVSGREAIEAFGKVAFYLTRINGSHHILKRDGDKGRPKGGPRLLPDARGTLDL